MLKRVAVAVVGIPLVFLILFFAPDWVLAVTISLLSMIAVYEVLDTSGMVHHRAISTASIILAGLIPFWSHIGSPYLMAVSALFAYVLFLFLMAMNSHYQVSIQTVGGAFFLTVMIPYFLSAFVRIRALPEWSYYIILPCLVAWCSDTFALFVGMAFGKHKLAPELSPKKTIEGAIGGLLGSVLCSMLYGLVIVTFFQAPQVNYLALAVMGLLGATVGQLGDLSFSYIKRQCHLKDFGDLIPGHGGVLDRFDSIIFSAPLVEIMILCLPIFLEVTW